MRLRGEAHRLGELLELNEDAEIRELTIFYRPLPGLATFAATAAPELIARRRGRVRSLIARAMTFPLGLLTRLGDRALPWFT